MWDGGRGGQGAAFQFVYWPVMRLQNHDAIDVERVTRAYVCAQPQVTHSRHTQHSRFSLAIAP